MAPFRWTLYGTPRNVRHIFWNLVYLPKYIARYAMFVWGDYDGDWEPLAAVMEIKLRAMAANHRRNQIIVGWERAERQCLVAAECLRRLLDDPIAYERPYFSDKTHRYTDRQQNEIQAMLGLTIAKHMRTWWD